MSNSQRRQRFQRTCCIYYIHSCIHIILYMMLFLIPHTSYYQQHTIYNTTPNILYIYIYNLILLSFSCVVHRHTLHDIGISIYVFYLPFFSLHFIHIFVFFFTKIFLSLIPIHFYFISVEHKFFFFSNVKDFFHIRFKQNIIRE